MYTVRDTSSNDTLSTATLRRKFLSNYQFGEKQLRRMHFRRIRHLVEFLPWSDSEHKIIQILHRKGQNKIWTELSSLGQEATFKSEQAHTDIVFSNSLLGKPLRANHTQISLYKL